MRYITTLTLLLVCTMSFAQLATGIRLGFTAGTPIGKAEEGATGKLGLGTVAGVVVEYNITDKWGLRTEAYYTQKKSSFSTPASVDEYDYLYEPPGSDTAVWIVAKFDGDVDGKFDNRYVEMPLLAHYYVSDRWNVAFGPYLGYLLRGEISGTSNGTVRIGVADLPVDNQLFDESQHLSPWDYGLIGSMRYETDFGLNYEFRLSSGLSSVFKETYPLADGIVRNMYVQLTAGYRFTGNNRS